jgi:hypothetical protein
MRSALTLLLFIATTSVVPAQKLVDPTKVAPEYREAAEQRRAEQIKQRECMQKAQKEKILVRERTAFLSDCLAH